MSKVILWATLVLVMCLAMVLGLVLMLLAQLYCSLLLRRRRLLLQITTTSNTTTTTTSTWTTHAARNDCLPQPQPQQLQDQSSAALQPLTSFYEQGVLRAPGTFLFPTVHSKEDHKVVADVEKQNSQLRLFFLAAETREPKPTSLPSPVTSSVSSPKPTAKVTTQGGSSSGTNGGARGGGGGCGGGEHDLVYISNPIYVNDAACCGPSSVDTPFETPDTSPSRLETGGSSSSTTIPSSPFTSLLVTPPLTPMAKLPAEACPVSLRDAGSLPTSGSDSNANHCLSSSSSSGASPHNSPSC